MKSQKRKENCLHLDISVLESNQSAYSEFNNYNSNTSTNQNQSLLVSSSLRHEALNANQTYLNKNYQIQNDQNFKNKIIKTQGKFNNRTSGKSKENFQQFKEKIQNMNKIQSFFNAPASKEEQLCCQNKICIKCQDKMASLQRRVKQTELKLQKIQSILNISYTKHMHQQTIMSNQTKELQTIKYLVWQTRKKDQSLRQESTLNQIFVKKEMNSMKESMQKLSNKLKKQQNDLKQLIQLQKTLLNQKLNNNGYNFQKKIEQLIVMIEDVSKLQNKLIIDKKNEQNKENIDYRGRLSKSKEKANKISYYLSKSICNQSTIIGDSSVNINSNFVL